jgi:alpha-glucosidase
VERRGDTVTLRGEVDGEGYPEFRRQAFRLVLHGATPERVEHDGEGVEATEGGFVLPNSGQAFEVTVTVG